MVKGVKKKKSRKTKPVVYFSNGHFKLVGWRSRAKRKEKRRWICVSVHLEV